VGPGGAVRVALGVTKATAPLALPVTVDITNLMIEKGAVLTGYFDGGTPDTGGYYYTWSAAENASTSLAVFASTDPCGYCSDFALSYLPPYSQMTVDGKVRRAYATVEGQGTRAASNLLYGEDGGPMSWSELSCGMSYLMSIDVPPDQVANVAVAVSLTRQE
jgi:hypothetical protein